MRLLVADLEPRAAREKRRDSAGRSADDDFAATLSQVAPDAVIETAQPIDGEQRRPGDYHAVILTGSPINLWRDGPETRQVVEFVRAVFASGRPCWGSCAGLQAAVVAAGGSVRPADEPERGVGRDIARTDAGRDHPMFEGRSLAWDAPTVHTDEVERLPRGAVHLAQNGATHVQAIELRVGDSVFWGTQYHPEISLFEVAAALRRQVDAIVEQRLAADTAAVEAYADEIEALHHDRGRRDIAWTRGIGPDLTDDGRRTTELRNFVERLVRPGMA